MKFIDEVKVHVKAGNGGAGCVSWIREKFKPQGGPNGGNGGNGGAVVLVTEPGLNTLIDYSFKPLLIATNGEQGQSNLKDGKSASDLVCFVPIGTQVFFKDKLAADLSAPGAKWVAARGGRGGKGNAFFKSSTNQAPDYAQPGQEGEEFDFRLVLKSVADIGLVGLPNVGKSTLISRVTKSQPKVADYPFTTLTPHLGVAIISDKKKFVIADIPGLIPGAHEGKGLGIKFLKHIERTKVLLHIIDLSVSNAVVPEASNLDSLQDDNLRRIAIEQFSLIDQELLAFSSEFSKTPRIVAFSKIDLEDNKKAFELTKDYFAAKSLQCLGFSSQTGEGIPELLSALSSALDNL